MNKIISIVIALYVGIIFTSPAFADLSDGLIAYFPFTGNADDAGGNGYDGTVYGGAALTADRFGMAESAYYFDGVNDYIDIGNNESLQPLDSFSVMAWVMLDSLSSNFAHIVSMSGAVPNGFTGYAIQARGSAVYFSLGNGSNGYYHAVKGNVIEAGKWYHLAGIYSGSTQSLYINGEEVRTIESGEYTQTSNSLNIGRMPTGVNYTQGVIDEVRIYNRALSSAEIAQLAAVAPEPVSSILFVTGGTLFAGRSYMKRKKRA